MRRVCGNLLEKAGFRNIELSREAHRFSVPSFDAYFGPFERDGAPTGQAYQTLPQSVRDSVRKDCNAVSETRVDL